MERSLEYLRPAANLFGCPPTHSGGSLRLCFWVHRLLPGQMRWVSVIVCDMI